MVIQPVTSAAISEIGQSPTGLLPGSWVVGFFRDPDFFQEPIIMGSIAGIPIQRGVDIGSGFRDPNDKYPIENRLYESDLSRLARNEFVEDTIVQTKKDAVEKDVGAAIGEETWNEPETTYDAVYPNNHVMQTSSGHIQEFDDTPDKERIHTYHKSGTFEEVHPDGTVVRKIVAKNYEIILDDDRVLIKGKKSENIEGNSNLKIGGDLRIEVDGDAYVVVKGDTIMQTDGDHFHKVKGTYSIASEGNITMIAPRIDFNPAGRSATDVGGII
jgi:hypothetical protein